MGDIGGPEISRDLAIGSIVHIKHHPRIKGIKINWNIFKVGHFLNMSLSVCCSSVEFFI